MSIAPATTHRSSPSAGIIRPPFLPLTFVLFVLFVLFDGLLAIFYLLAFNLFAVLLILLFGRTLVFVFLRLVALILNLFVVFLLLFFVLFVDLPQLAYSLWLALSRQPVFDFGLLLPIFGAVGPSIVRQGARELGRLWLFLLVLSWPLLLLLLPAFHLRVATPIPVST